MALEMTSLYLKESKRVRPRRAKGGREEEATLLVKREGGQTANGKDSRILL